MRCLQRRAKERAADRRVGSDTSGAHAGRPSLAQMVVCCLDCTRTSPPPLTSRPWIARTRPTPDAPALGWSGGLRPFVSVSRAIDRRHHPESPLPTVGALLDIDAG